MSELKDKLIEASNTDDFLQTVYDAARGSKDDSQAVIEAIVEIHNIGSIDIVDQFKNLKNSQSGGPDFFLTRRVFEKALPKLRAPVQAVMECVLHLLKEAGQDLAATWIIQPFIDYCIVDSERTRSVINFINESPEKWKDFVCPILIAGCRIDINQYFKEAIKFTSHENIEVRRGAVFALGRIELSEKKELQESVLKILSEIVLDETDDHLIGNIIKSSCSISIINKELTKQVLDIVNSALNSAGDFSLHAASEEFGYKTKELPEELLDDLLSNLLNVKPLNQGTIDNIDYGIHELLRKDDPSKGIDFLENYLLRNSDSISLKKFDSVVHGIIQADTKLINKLLTRWFLKGDHVLCTGICDVIHSVHGEELVLEADDSEYLSGDRDQSIFLARKIIGYLFFKPVTCASLIVSLMKQSNNSELINSLGLLLFEPLLLNYSGALYTYLEKQVKNETGDIKLSIQSAINMFDSYLEGLRSAGRISELQPSEEQRAIHANRMNQLFSESYKQAMKNSIVEQLCTKSVLLYGRKSIHLFNHPTAGPQQTELNMKSFGTSIEFPRQEHLDPFGLDYMIRVFKSEKLATP